MLSMERDYFYPSIADREEPTVWQEQGALDHLSRAKTKAKELLNHHPNYLSDEIEASMWRNDSRRCGLEMCNSTL